MITPLMSITETGGYVPDNNGKSIEDAVKIY